MSIIRSDPTAGLVIDSDNTGNITFVTGGSNIAMQINSSGMVDLSSSRLILPVGNTATRPAAIPGLLRFNNESNVFEASNGNTWTSLAGAGSSPLGTSFILHYLVVAGGGGGGTGGSGYEGGAGGAGGLRTSWGSVSGGGAGAETALIIEKATEYTLTVGAGAANWANGSPSVFSTIECIGGGRGGRAGPAGAPLVGDSGGSGGGGGVADAPGTSASGNGTANQGYPGGQGYNRNGNSPNIASGGGGGAGGAGGNATPGVGGNGGNGIQSSISGALTYYAGGGGGSVFAGTAGSGGLGGGGAGAVFPTPAQDGAPNTGGGGGGSISTGNSGGSGVVILRHPSSYTMNVSPGLTYTTNTTIVPEATITTFTAGTGIVQWNWS